MSESLQELSVSAEPQDSPAFLAGGGDMGALLRAYDWRGTALGSPMTWPQSLRTALRIMLTSRQPIWIGWGQELTFFYNDAYKPIIGGKHPWALGRPTSEVWREIWADIGPMLATAMEGTEGTYVEEQLLIMERNGYPEETYYTFSYSPIPNDDGSAGGIICANSEDTKRVIGERQLALLRDLSTATADTRNWQEVCQRAARALATNVQDLPFALLYVGDSGADTLTLMGSSGIPADHPAAANTVAIDSSTLWPFAEVLRGQEINVVVETADERSLRLPTGAWHEAPRQVALLPIQPAGDTGRRGVLVAGINPFRLFDGNYRDFLLLVAGGVAAAVANAEAFENERLRAESLAEIDRAKTAFFSNVSHEFRTPLTLMLGPLEESLADADRLPPEERERVAVVHRNGMRLLRLVNSLLDFSRIEAGRTNATFEATDLALLSAELASNFRSATERAGLELDIDCPALPAPVYVDRQMWETIVLNLMSNAFKFTFAGKISVSLRASADAAQLTVRDTGTGIPAHELPRLFERFHRIEGAQGRSFEGSGIGLALVKELVDAHHGRIHADSEEGGGTAFVVTVPLGSAHLPAERVRDARPLTGPGGNARAVVEEALRWLPNADVGADFAHDMNSVVDAPESVAPEGPSDRSRIVVVDDNADMRDYICRLLGARHECVTMPDGEAALLELRRRRPDLVLTDIMMPRLDGFGLLRAIREDPNLRDLPVIVLSARAGEESSVEGLSAGADDYLSKPFSARELMARIDGALAMSRVRRSMGDALREEARSLEILNRVGSAVAAELDLEKAVQLVTDAATELTGAAFGAFFYNVLDERGESYRLYALSGVPREAFANFPMPRNTHLFAPTFNGEGIVRIADILTDARYGRNAPHSGMPLGHLPVRSYMAAPVVSRSGEVIGGLLFGHPEPGVFTEREAKLLHGIAAQAAIAIDNARLYQAVQKSEERLQKLNESLESIVAERTLELEAANAGLRSEAEQREKIEHVLRQSQKMEAVGKLTGGVAHDFNNLLQVVGGNLQLLSKDVVGNERAELRLRNALAGVARGSKLASQLLAFGRRQPLAPKVVNLGRFIRGLDDLLRRALGDGVEIETVISGGLWNTLVDPSHVENALLNLAINARDAMAGHGRLTIEAGNSSLGDDYVAQNSDVTPGQYVMLAVTDTGSGMTADVLEHVFEPFFTTKPEGQGTGLGLSMVYGFVKQSNGHIKIYSEPGHGSTIRIYLPRVLGVEDVATEVDAGPVVGGSETVLVVEDDEDVRGTVVDLLIDLGYRVLKARDAQSALAIIESGTAIDLLFTDVVMPGPLRSPELARQARVRLPDVAVLFTSGYTDNAIVHGGRLDAGIELLSKPYTREALARKLRQVLRGRKISPATAARRTVRSLPSGEGKASRRLKVLYVEDDDLIRLATRDMLEGLGHRVVDAGDAAHALRLLGAAEFDVLITDLGLPGMTGDKMAVEMRARRPKLKIIFASGAMSPELAEGGDALADALHLHKPYDIDALDRVLRTVGERRGAKK